MLENSLSPARIVSLCVSKPKSIMYQGHELRTGIFKEPVQGKVALRRLNLDGDEQADLTVHGGVDKALYVYAAEHYPFWRNELPDTKFEWGAFGENLTTEGLLEGSVCIGDEFQAGTAVIRVTQPRLPCYKLALKIGRSDIIKRFMKSGRSGIYFSVLEEGVLGVDDEIKYLRSDQHKVTVAEVASLFGQRDYDAALVERILNSNLAAQMKGFVSDAFERRR